MEQIKFIMKTITITPKETLQEFKDSFNAMFPNLKIEFFAENHESGEGNSLSDLLTDLSATLESASDVDHEFSMSVDGHKKVSTLEKDFSDLGLNLQVFRKSGNVWLQTTTTDHWTLAEQNKEAEAALS